MVYEKAGKLEEAIESYNKAIAIDPDNVETIGNLARALVRHGDHGDQVRKLMGELVERDSRPEWIDWARQWLAMTPNKDL